MKRSVLVPFASPRFDAVRPYAELVAGTAAHRLWQGQSLQLDPLLGFATAAAGGVRVPVGIGVTLMPLRHPLQAALAARSLALATRRSVVVGFGPGSVELQESLGDRYERPLTACREYLTIVRELLHGGRSAFCGRYYSCHAALSAAPSPPVSVGLGVLRPAMARLAGEVADAAITWLTPAAYLEGTILPALREGAARAGRPEPRLVAMVPVALDRPGRDGGDLAHASNALHLSGEHYRDMLRRAGVRLNGDEAADARRLVEAGAFLYGERDAVEQQLGAYERAGVHEVVLNATGSWLRHGPEAALDDLRQLVAMAN